MTTLTSCQRNCTFQPVHSLKYQAVLDAQETAAGSSSRSLGAHQGPLVKTEDGAGVLWLGIGPGAVGLDSETARSSGDLCSTTLSQVLSLPS